MAEAAARVSGTVLRVSERSGTKINAETKESRAWKMTTARVLVGGENIADVTMPDTVVMPEKLDVVDWLVSVRASGSFLNLDYVSEWDPSYG